MLPIDKVPCEPRRDAMCLQYSSRLEAHHVMPIALTEHYSSILDDKVTCMLMQYKVMVSTPLIVRCPMPHGCTSMKALYEASAITFPRQ